MLNQNPALHASSTSALAGSINNLSAHLSESPEVKSDLAHDRKDTEARITSVLRGVVRSWYEPQFDASQTVFDKSRAWNFRARELAELFPAAKLIVCVRDIRDVFASIEARHNEFPFLRNVAAPRAATQWERAQVMSAPDGVIGSCVAGIEELIRYGSDRVVFFQYESFADSPRVALDALYQVLGLDSFDHDFDNVENTATDLDAFYNYKFPHTGSGPIRPHTSRRHVLGSDILAFLSERFAWFHKNFEYRLAA